MDIKRRLLVAFIIMVMFPCVMMSMVSVVIMMYQTNSIQEGYELETETFQVLFSNPMQVLNKMTRKDYNDLVTIAQQSPDSLLDKQYAMKLNNELKEKYSFLIVSKEEEIVFCGNIDIFKKMGCELPKYGDYHTKVDGGLYVSGKIPYLLKQYNFVFSDNQQGSVYIITNVNILMPELKSILVQGIVSILIILVTTACLLLVWLYRGIVKPIKVLKNAMNQVKEGNLNFKVDSSSMDEIGELCMNFDEMREHLKEEIAVRIQYEQDLRELISNISHDLKTPLTAIQGYAEGLLDGVADTKEKQEKYLRTIYKKAEDMTALVEELSYYTKIDANTIPYLFEQVELKPYFEDCIEELSLDLEGKNCKLLFSSELEDTQKALLDREQLKRVINNIIGNALKYQDKKEGIIEIRLHDAKDMVQVEIKDNGSGIDEKALPYIFDRFYRADSSRNSKKGGTGLGLAIVKKVVVEHGGIVWAESKKNEGTQIYFTLRKIPN